MLKNYVKSKLKSQEFINEVNNKIQELNGKKILLCGTWDSFVYLNKIFHFDKKLDIAAFAQFENINAKNNKIHIKIIKPDDIMKENFDSILITGEKSDSIKNQLNNFILDNTKINIIFDEELKDTAVNLDFLLKHNFDKNLKKLSKKLENKKVLFYGGGLFFQLVNKFYDLSSINAIGIVDKGLAKIENCKNVCGYKVYSPEQIKELCPDYIVVSARRIVPIFEDLYYNYLKDTKIKIIPLVKRGLISLIKEG